MKLEWEQIDDYHQRARVPGGWLVKAYEEVVHNMMESGRGMESGYDIRVAMCFVPDSCHQWRLEE